VSVGRDKTRTVPCTVCTIQLNEVHRLFGNVNIFSSRRIALWRRKDRRVHPTESQRIRSAARSMCCSVISGYIVRESRHHDPVELARNRDSKLKKTRAPPLLLVSCDSWPIFKYLVDQLHALWSPIWHVSERSGAGIPPHRLVRNTTSTLELYDNCLFDPGAWVHCLR
jgi:hypothetical protein